MPEGWPSSWPLGRVIVNYIARCISFYKSCHSPNWMGCWEGIVEAVARSSSSSFSTECEAIGLSDFATNLGGVL
jgi:hypothetical protein